MAFSKPASQAQWWFGYEEVFAEQEPVRLEQLVATFLVTFLGKFLYESFHLLSDVGRN